MGIPLTLQYVVIALAVLLSAWVVAKRQFPGGVRRARIALALPLLRDGRPQWMRMLGRHIAPAANASGAGACGGCNSCDPKP